MPNKILRNQVPTLTALCLFYIVPLSSKGQGSGGGCCPNKLSPLPPVGRAAIKYVCSETCYTQYTIP